MTTGTNTTLKGSIAFGAIIIAAAVVFASSQDGADETADAAQGEVAQGEVAAEAQYAPGSQAQRLAEDAAQIEEYDEEELLAWGEEALMDDTAGFDPTPGGEMGSNDDDIADVFIEVENNPRPRPDSGSGSGPSNDARPFRTPAANAPAANAPAAPTGRAAPSGPSGPPAPGGRVGIPSTGDLPG